MNQSTLTKSLSQVAAVMTVASLGSFALASNAFAATVTYDSNTTPATVGVPETLTNWGNPVAGPRLPVTIPQFNSSLGILTSVQIEITGTLTGQYSLTNRSDATSPLFYGNFVGTDTLSANIRVADTQTGLGGTVVTINVLPTDPIGGGQLNAGQNFSTALDGTQTVSQTLTTGLTPYIGTGNVTLYAQALGLNQVAKSGGIPVETSDIFGAVSLRVIYTYDLQPASVPEPSTIVGLVAVGGAGLLAGRRRKS